MLKALLLTTSLFVGLLQAQISQPNFVRVEDKDALARKYTGVFQMIAGDLEISLKIKFPDNLPRLEFSDTVPSEDARESSNTLARFNRLSNTIFIFARTEPCERKGYCVTEEEMKALLAHELGHAFTMVLIGEIPLGGWLNQRYTFPGEIPLETHFGLLIAWEGIATNFEDFVEYREPQCLEFWFNETYSLGQLYEKKNCILYEFSKMLFRPIISEFRSRGLRYIAAHPLLLNFDGMVVDERRSFVDAVRYRDQALQELRRGWGTLTLWPQ